MNATVLHSYLGYCTFDILLVQTICVRIVLRLSNAYMKHTLEHHKLKKTANREVVLEILGKANKPLSADDIFVLVKKSKAFGASKSVFRNSSSNASKGKIPDLVTIYRTLETFTQAGIVKEVLFKDRTTRYEIMDEHGGHCHHAICNSCGASEHVDDPTIEKALHTLAKKFKHIKKVDEHLLEFFGTCTSCSTGERKLKVKTK